MLCGQYNTNQSLWSSDSRAIIGWMTADIWRLSADGSLIKCHRPTVWRSTADWRRATFGRYHDAKIFKKSADLSADHRATIGRSFTDDKTPENRRIGQRNFKLGCFDKKSSADQKICQNRCRRRPTIGRRRPIFPF